MQLPKNHHSWRNDLYEYRKETIELLFQRIIQAFDIKQCPVKGKAKNGVLVLVTIWTYQVCWLNNYRRKKNPSVVKEHIENARWRLKLWIKHRLQLIKFQKITLFQENNFSALLSNSRKAKIYFWILKRKINLKKVKKYKTWRNIL